MPGRRDKAHGKLYQSNMIPVRSRFEFSTYSPLNPISTYIRNVEIPNTDNIINNNDEVEYGNWLPNITVIGRRRLESRGKLTK